MWSKMNEILLFQEKNNKQYDPTAADHKFDNVPFFLHTS